MASRYFLQLSGGPHWEEVDEYIYKNWKFAVREKGSVDDSNDRRYSGNCVSIVDNRVSVYFDKEAPGITTKDMAWIARMLGAAKHELDGYVDKGIYTSPDYVMIKKNNATILKRVGGEAFTAKAKTV